MNQSPKKIACTAPAILLGLVALVVVWNIIRGLLRLAIVVAVVAVVVSLVINWRRNEK